MSEEQAKTTLRKVGFLKGHNGWVTCMKVGTEEVNGEFREFLLSGSRDSNLLIWDLATQSDAIQDDVEMGVARKVLTGHSHFVSDLDLSQDNRFAVSSSWDGTIRLWDLKNASTRKTLIGHDKDVLSVAFSPDNRQITSGSMDKNVKIWNIHGVCKFTVDQKPHTDWVSCVRYHYDAKTPIVISASWDRSIKVWDNNAMQLMHTFVAHKAQITCLDHAENTNFLASGGKDGMVNIWNIVEGRHLESIDVDAPVNAVLFAAKQFWLVIAHDKGISVYDLPKKRFIHSIQETRPRQELAEGQKAKAARAPAPIPVTSLAFSKNQTFLYAGYADSLIRVYEVTQESQ